MDVPLHQHWHDIYTKRWLVVLTALAAAGIAWVASSLVTPVYQAKTTFYLAANAVPATFSGTRPDSAQPPLLPIPEEKAASIDIGILRGTEMMRRLSQATEIDRAQLARMVDVTVNSDFMIDVFVRDTDPAIAAEVANQVPGLYREFHEGTMRRTPTGIAEALALDLASLETQRDNFREQVRAAREQSQSAADPAALAAVERDRDAAGQALAGLGAQLAETRARLASLDAALSAEAALYRDGDTTDKTNTLEAMEQRLIELRGQLASATAEGPASPRRAAAENEIAALEAAISVENDRLKNAAAKPQGSLFEALRLERAKVAAEFAAIQAGRPASEEKFNQASARFDTVLTALSDSEQYSEQLAAIEARISATKQNLAAAEMQSANVAAPVVVVSTADTPTRPVFPLPLLNTLVAGLSGLILGTYYALWVAHAERGKEARVTARTKLPIFTDDERRQLRQTGAARPPAAPQVRPMVLGVAGTGGTTGE